MYEIGWIDLPGVVNMRDVGGIPTVDAQRIASGRLIRSDNLQGLPADTLAHLVEQLGVTDVIDLRSFVEIAQEGSGPFMAHSRVRTTHFTLYADDTQHTGIPEGESDPERPGHPPAAVAGSTGTVQDAELPWVVKDRRRQQAGAPAFGAPEIGHDKHWSTHYLGYLAERPESIVGALRVIARAEGATIVHCAAGKDRTGTVVGLALATVGAHPDAIVADYAATAERIEPIIARLRERPAYRDSLSRQTVAQQTPRPETMRLLLGALDDHYGGVLGWLTGQGWTNDDTDALHAKLRG